MDDDTRDHLDPSTGPGETDDIYRAAEFYSLDRADAEEMTTEPQPEPIEEAHDTYPKFPECAYVGLAGEVASYYADILEPPPCFLYMDYLTFQGGVLSPYLHTSIGEEPRLYTVKVAPYGSVRKSISQDAIRELFDGSIRVVDSVGSGEGLLTQLNRGPVILMPDEFSRITKKARLEASTLPESMTTLFNSNRCSHYVRSKENSIEVEDAHLSIVSATTPELYTTMFDPQGTSGGLVSRLFVVVSDEKRIKSPDIPDEGRVEFYRTKVKGQIDEIREKTKCGGERLVLPSAPDATERWKEYYNVLRQQDDRIYERLDTYGLRLAVLLAVTKEEWKISLATVESVIALLDYQKEARHAVQPVEAETWIAALAQLILRALRDGRWKRSDLYDRVHAERYGVWYFDRALDGLKEMGWVKEKHDGRTRYYNLTDEGRSRAQG
jgi:hypothetical protein